MFIFENKTVESKQEWQGKTMEFAPDSSPVAWEHYKQWYSETFKKFKEEYAVCSPSFFTYAKGVYIPKPKVGDFNRLYALSKEAELLTDESGNEYYKAVERLSGDVDFNFNNKHYPFFEACLKNEPKEYLRKEYLFKLEECTKMHYSLLNFSLMQTMGNMQKFKGKKCADRLDRFIYYLGRFYETDKRERHTTDIIHIKNGDEDKESNRKALMDYLNQFEDLTDYCKKIYFISDAGLIEKLRWHGQKNERLDSPEKVRTYIDLAYCFWEKKDFYFSKKEYLTINSYFSDGGETYTYEDLFHKLENDLGAAGQREIDVIIEKCLNCGFMHKCGNDCYIR